MACVLSLHSGKTVRYEEQGVSFETAICKQQMAGPVTITATGVEGNEVANHKNAIYAFCAENYDYWNATVKPATPWVHGMMGENLTLQGLEEHAVRIGDFFRVGSVILQVSGCRAPCANFLWRMQLPASFLRPFQESGRSGFYLEVVQTGTIHPGDLLHHYPCVHDSITVPDLARFFLDPVPDATELHRLLAVPGMGQQMLSVMTASLNQITERTLIASNRWVGWKRYVVSKIVSESTDINSFYLTPEDGGAVAGYRAGQFLTVRVPLSPDGVVTRCWSISSYDECLGHYRISIKKQPQGQASCWMHEQLKQGDTLEVMAPLGQFELDRSAIAQPVVLISAGAGITPMISMLHAHVARLDKKLPTLHFIHSTQRPETHAFREEVERVVSRFPQLHSHHIYTRAGSAATSARLDERRLTDILSNVGCWFSEKWIALGAADCAYYLCGPTAFMESVRGMLINLGVPDSAIAEESFNGAVSGVDAVEPDSADVAFARSCRSSVWDRNLKYSLLEMAEQAGLRPDYGCRSGQCGLCRCTLLEGEVAYRKTPAASIAAGEVLLCCAVPVGDVVLDC